MNTSLFKFFLLLALCANQAWAQSRKPAQELGAQTLVHGLLWDVHEVSVAQVKRYAAATGFVSQAEKEGGGFIYESGWTQKKGWNWRAPFGVTAHDAEPAVHLTFDEAQQICRAQGRRLPTDTSWLKAPFFTHSDQPLSGLF